jgi:hypothetical protein
MMAMILCADAIESEVAGAVKEPTVDRLKKRKVARSAFQQWLEIYWRIYGKDKSRNRANEGSSDS